MIFFILLIMPINIDMYPKVLIIGQSFNLTNGGGITLTNLFKGWDKNCIAVASERIFNPDDRICEKYYQLGYNESKRKFPFNLIEKKFRSGVVQLTKGYKLIKTITENNKKHPSISAVYDSLLHFFGLYHYSRNLRTTAQLLDWIKDYKPDIIYTQLSTLAQIRFVSAINDSTGIPITIHIMDDWPTTISKAGILQPFWEKKIDKEFRSLLDKTSVFLSISDAMSEEYFKRYNKQFIPFHNPIEIHKWNTLSKQDYTNKTEYQILYTGRIGLGVDSCLVDIANTINELTTQSDYKISLTIQSKELPSNLSGYSFVKQRFIEDYDQYPQSLLDADLLILPYDFSEKALNFIRLSFPTKASEYMISGTPILLYASKDTAICKHALQYKWAYVVSENTNEALAKAITDLIINKELRKTLSDNARNYALENFNAEKVREKLINSLKTKHEIS